MLKVVDSSSTPQTWQNTMALTVNGAPSSSPATPATPAVAQATFAPDPRPAGIPDEYQIQFTPSTSGTNEVLTIRGGSLLPTVTVNGTAYTIGEDRQVLVDVEPGMQRPRSR